MMLAHGPGLGIVLVVGILYLSVTIGSVLTFIASFLERRPSSAHRVSAMISTLFGLVLSALFMHVGMNYWDAFWLVALVPLACGSVAWFRLNRIGHRHKCPKH